MSQTMSTTTASGESAAIGFQQRLGLFDGVMLIAGTMIGSGIFVVSADIARDVGSAGWLLAVWCLAGFLTVIGALAYAELAGMMPHAGGQYVFLREAYSPLWGFLYGWTCFLVIQTGSIAAVSVVFAKYLGVLVPVLGTDNLLLIVPDVNLKLYLPFMADAQGKPLPFFEMDRFTISAGQLVAVAVLVFLTWLNCRGVQEGKVVQNLFTIAKMLGLIALIVIGLTLAADATVWSANTENLWAGIAETKAFQDVQNTRPAQWLGGSFLVVALMVAGGAMVGALFSADAWNNVTFIAGEMRNPQRNLPLSLALGTGLVITLYLLANLAYVNSLPMQPSAELMQKIEALEKAGKQDELQQLIATTSPREFGIARASEDRVATAVVRLVSPEWGVGLMALAIMISTFGCVNGMTLMGARLYYAMSRDGLFFKSVGTLNSRAVPAAGLILQMLWSVLLVFSGTYNELLDFVIFAVLVFYVLTVAGLFVLRYKMPNAERPARAIGYPVLPALYVVLCSLIMVDLLIVRPKFTWPGLIIVLTGIPVYYLWRWRNPVATGM
jgi:APA family basic amino acid/polyamine antiporter